MRLSISNVVEELGDNMHENLDTKGAASTLWPAIENIQFIAFLWYKMVDAVEHVESLTNRNYDYWQGP